MADEKDNRVNQGKPDIFTYLDYRAYLKDAFAGIKSGAPRLSFRTFAKKAGFTSPNFLQMVIQGKRNLSTAYQVITAKAFKLNKQETDFFQNLVGYDQAKSHEEKDLFYQRILKNGRYASAKTLDRSQYEFFSHWYIPVVRELLTHEGFRGDDAWIADRIRPRITPAQVGSARALLERLGLIRRNQGDGTWEFTSAVVSTESEVTDLALRNYHMAAIQLGHDAIKGFPPHERDIRSVTIGIPEKAFGELKTRVEGMWKDILAFAAQYGKAESVYQVNLQMFPLTRDRKKPNA